VTTLGAHLGGPEYLRFIEIHMIAHAAAESLGQFVGQGFAGFDLVGLDRRAHEEGLEMMLTLLDRTNF
jgi:hypothetical protein